MSSGAASKSFKQPGRKKQRWYVSLLLLLEPAYAFWGLVNPRRACAVRVTVLGLSFRLSVHLSVCLSVCYHVFCHYAQQGGQKAIPTGSVPHWLDFKNGDFCKSTAFKSYGMNTKQTSQYANEHGSDSARFKHGGGSRSNTKGEYVVLACQKHYLST